MTKAFALNLSMKALLFYLHQKEKRDRLNLLDSLFSISAKAAITATS